ncbi:MAG: N-acetylmuramidase family protein [Deltaproteobacteria bacterium]|nr:N-acetylmuramidase family protein [Deltaproteobacteria bacterium]
MFPTELINEGADLLEIEPSVLKAVISIESDGEPFLSPGAKTPLGLDISGFPVVQFEGHVFWKELSSLKSPDLLPGSVLTYPSKYMDPFGKPLRGELVLEILYPKFTLKYVKRPKAEWDQLLRARCIHETAANRSASWGAFQILGKNHSACACRTIQEFMDKMTTLPGQLDIFISFIKSDKRLWNSLKTKNWTAFARGYNGTKYYINKYDKKMKAEYDKINKNI